MGWWGSSSPGDKPSSQTTPTIAPEPPSSKPSTSNSTPTSAPHDDDAEFHAAFPHLAPTVPAHETPSTSSETSSTASSTFQAFAPSEYPETMSCRAAFDSAFYCASFGGHFNDLYRYGELRSCSEHWSDFWFCMRLNGKGSEIKKALVRERYKEKEDRVRAKPNSEDVWERRGERERIEGAFRKAEEEYHRVERS